MMSDKPKRIQRKRTKGFRLKDASSNPNGVVYVGRPTKWGNPFPLDIYHEDALVLYRRWLFGEMSVSEMDRLSYYGDPRIGLPAMRHSLRPNELRGKDLACFCKETEPCHADILLELANQ